MGVGREEIVVCDHEHVQKMRARGGSGKRTDGALTATRGIDPPQNVRVRIDTLGRICCRLASSIRAAWVVTRACDEAQ